MIKVSHVSKIYKTGGEETKALFDVSFSIKKGEFVAIMGPSGSGKSTLMHIVGCLDVPTSGVYMLDGQNVGRLSDDSLAKIRNEKIGFVFQSYNLLPRISVLKNVLLPSHYSRKASDGFEERAKKLLDLVGLAERMNFMPNQISGGQQQRVAIARALLMNPSIILADEPTGNLASDQAETVMKTFQKLHKEGHTIVMITHEPTIASYAKRIIRIKDGKLIKN